MRRLDPGRTRPAASQARILTSGQGLVLLEVDGPKDARVMVQIGSRWVGPQRLGTGKLWVKAPPGKHEVRVSIDGHVVRAGRIE